MKRFNWMPVWLGMIAMSLLLQLVVLVWARPGPTNRAPEPAHKGVRPGPLPRGLRPVAPVHKGVDKEVKNYHTRFGKEFRGGRYYDGWDHHHWQSHYYDERYGCYLYEDPGLKTWYYWCAPQFRYYPVSYVPLGYVFPYVAEPRPPERLAPLPPGASQQETPPPGRPEFPCVR